MKFLAQYQAPIGTLWVGEENGKLTLISYTNKDQRLHGYVEQKTAFLESVFQQLEEYFAGTRQTFNVPIQTQGTDFQEAVWRELQTIPYGETKTYKEVAERINNPKACRAVGLANNRNPISIIIPCHRVVGQNGKLTGYGGGLNAKEYLLELEQKNV